MFLDRTGGRTFFQTYFQRKKKNNPSLYGINSGAAGELDVTPAFALPDPFQSIVDKNISVKRLLPQSSPTTAAPAPLPRASTSLPSPQRKRATKTESFESNLSSLERSVKQSEEKTPQPRRTWFQSLRGLP